MTRPEATDTNWNTGGTVWTSGNAVTVRVTQHWHRLPGKWQVSPSLRQTKVTRTRSWAIGSGRPCLSRGAGPAALQRCLPKNRAAAILYLGNQMPSSPASRARPRLSELTKGEKSSTRGSPAPRGGADSDSSRARGTPRAFLSSLRCPRHP